MVNVISVETAAEIIAEKLPGWGTETLSLPTLGGEYWRAIRTDRPYPPVERVMMDGIALAWDTYQSGQRVFPVLGTVAPGEPPRL